MAVGIKVFFWFTAFVGIGYGAGSLYYRKRISEYDTRIQEVKDQNWLDNIDPISSRLSLLDLLNALETIEDDDRIMRLVIDFSHGNVPNPIGLATCQEIRNALSRLGQKKRLIAVTDSWQSQSDYYLATACNEIVMEPFGSLNLSGFSLHTPFIKKFLDKWGIVVTTFQAGIYKALNSPFTSTEYSSQERENINSVLNGLDSIVEEAIRNSRNLNTKILKRQMTAKECLDAGLIDRIDYKRKYTPISSITPNCMLFERYANIVKKKRGDVTIALVHLVGMMNRGSGKFGSNTICKALIEASQSPNVSAIILRIDSGGGDVVATDSIWETVNYVKNTLGVPIVASFGNMAASGAYYVSCPCNMIYASPTTITGSIGVASLKPTIPKETLEQYGIHIDSIGSEEAKNESIFYEMTPKAIQQHQEQVDYIYSVFKSKVLSGRGLESTSDVDEGRIFTGKQALALGLVDQMGGITEAIQGAYQLCNKSGKIVLKTFPEAKPFWQIGESPLEIINSSVLELITNIMAVFEIK